MKASFQAAQTVSKHWGSLPGDAGQSARQVQSLVPSRNRTDGMPSSSQPMIVASWVTAVMPALSALAINAAASFSGRRVLCRSVFCQRPSRNCQIDVVYSSAENESPS